MADRRLARSRASGGGSPSARGVTTDLDSPSSPLELLAAPHTPFSEDGGLALDVVPQQAHYFRERGVVGVFITGTTGEGHSLTSEERRTLIDRWSEVRREAGLRLLVHVGANSLGESRELAAAAAAAGADGIAMTAPSFFKPNTTAALVDFAAGVAAAAPETPFYYYEIPRMTGYVTRMAEFLPRMADAWPGFRGLKYTHPDLVELQRCLAFDDGRLEVYFGVDELLLPALALGVRKAVGSTYNFAAALHYAIGAAYDRQDFPRARELQWDSVRLVDVLSGFDFLPASKVLMELLGTPCGGVRPPLRSLEPAARDRLQEALAVSGLWELLTQKEMT